MSNGLPILYSFRRCPYAMRARFALYWAGVEHEHREISLKNKPQAMLQVSPKGTVPVLVLPQQKKIIEQSLDIMIFALGNISEKDHELIRQNDTVFKHALDRYKYPDRYEQNNNHNYQQECLIFINYLENNLKNFLSGNNPSLVDMALFPFVRQFAKVDYSWFEKQDYPQVKKWLSYFLSSAIFEQVMKKYNLWTE